MTSRVRVCALVVVLVACVGALGACANDEAGGRMRAFDDTGFPPDAIEEGWMVALPASDADLGTSSVRTRRVATEPTATIQEADVLGSGGAWQPLGARRAVRPARCSR